MIAPQSSSVSPSTGSGAVSFREATRVWARVALLSFGGPAGQIATMHRIIVEERRWIGEERFLHALNFCMLLPGPEAQQLATYIGWLMHRSWGGIVAGGLFVLPGLVAIMALSWLYVLGGELAWVEAVFFGLKAAVLAIVVDALIRIGRRSLRARASQIIAAGAFVALFAFAVPFPIVILVAAGVGVAAHRAGLAVAPSEQGGGGEPLAEAAVGGLTLRRVSAIAAAALILWALPILAIATLAPESVFAEIASFFATLAVVTFGGAYAVLAYVAQAGVTTLGWLTPEEMLDGLAMAETTPGPLIMVLQFVGFLAAYRDPGTLPPLLAATLGGLLTTWVTFVPSFLFVFLGAPVMERLRHNRALAAALAGITSAVVGVVLNLALWFGLHVIFDQVGPVAVGPAVLELPDLRSIDLTAAVLAVGAGLALIWLRVGMIWTLLGCALLGLLLGAGGLV